MSEYVNIGPVPLPRPGLPTFIHHLCVGILRRYPLGYTVRKAWAFRNFSAILSIEPLSAEEIAHVKDLIAELEAGQR